MSINTTNETLVSLYEPIIEKLRQLDSSLEECRKSIKVRAIKSKSPAAQRRDQLQIDLQDVDQALQKRVKDQEVWIKENSTFQSTKDWYEQVDMKAALSVIQQEEESISKLYDQSLGVGEESRSASKELSNKANQSMAVTLKQKNRSKGSVVAAKSQNVISKIDSYRDQAEVLLDEGSSSQKI